MLIVDSQVHLWGANTPQRPWPPEQVAHRSQPIGKDEMLREMDAAGVDRLVIVPPHWEGDRNDIALEAARLHPDRFAVMGRLALSDSDARSRISTWRSQPGMYGIRMVFVRETELPFLTEGRLDWFWPVAEQADVRLMLLTPPPYLHLIDALAQRHPRLQIALDHLCLPPKTKDDASFAELDKLLALSLRSNISVKVSGMPCYSSQGYPYTNLHAHLRRVYDAFGPRRMFWGSDFSRLPCSYRQAVTLFTEELGWLTEQDREWIMGRGLCEWLGWPLP